MATDKKKRLLDEFPPHRYAEWKAAAEQLLKGRPFEKTLITPTYEGFDLEPIYTRETMARLAQLQSLPGMGDQVRGSRIEGYLETGWKVSQELSAPTAEALNPIVLHELECGQNELNLWLDYPTRQGKDPEESVASTGVCGLSLATVGDVAALMKGVRTEMISVYLQGGAAAPALTALFLAWAEQEGVGMADLSGCLGYDPLGWLAESGSLPGSTEGVFDLMADVIRHVGAKVPEMQVVEVRGHPYHGSGASSVQEMAAVLASAVVYLRELQARGLDPAEVVPRIRLSLSVGGDFFLEIAKFRALRLLWGRILDGFGVAEDARRIHLHARTGLWNKTRLDPYVNMLRTTTEAFAAVVGGVDSLHVGPFDEVVRESDAFSRRVARNTHAILAEECGMTEVIDPAGGSWAVESLTDQMAAQAWKTFQEIEAGGGMVEALRTGAFAKAVDGVRQTRMKNIERRKDVILGTNTYPNATEKVLEGRGIDYASIRKERCKALESFLETRDRNAVASALEAVRGASGADRLEQAVAAARQGATLGELHDALETGKPDLGITPFPVRRGAEAYEALRMAARVMAKDGKPPLLHQLNLGPSRRYRIRADWTSAFFHAAGIEVLNEDDYADANAALDALKASKAGHAILTSDDETYAEQAEAVAKQLKAAFPDLKLYLAGAPGESEASLRAAGIDDFVHVRVNNYQFNRALLEGMGATLSQAD